MKSRLKRVERSLQQLSRGRAFARGLIELAHAQKRLHVVRILTQQHGDEIWVATGCVSLVLLLRGRVRVRMLVSEHAPSAAPEVGRRGVADAAHRQAERRRQPRPLVRWVHQHALAPPVLRCRRAQRGGRRFPSAVCTSTTPRSCRSTSEATPEPARLSVVLRSRVTDRLRTKQPPHFLVGFEVVHVCAEARRALLLRGCTVRWRARASARIARARDHGLHWLDVEVAKRGFDGVGVFFCLFFALLALLLLPLLLPLAAFAFAAGGGSCHSRGRCSSVGRAPVPISVAVA
mmetsp:Transcript_9515/g.39133  ORF Transcript_9515/g.39133 Transcript_9515/m.39133 type:complete len:290 (+) Transcript_9515:939-1808(+)